MLIFRKNGVLSKFSCERGDKEITIYDVDKSSSEIQISEILQNSIWTKICFFNHSKSFFSKRGMKRLRKSKWGQHHKTERKFFYFLCGFDSVLSANPLSPFLIDSFLIFFWMTKKIDFWSEKLIFASSNGKLIEMAMLSAIFLYAFQMHGILFLVLFRNFIFSEF